VTVTGKLFGLVFAICGIGLFCHFNNSQRQFEAKLQSIQAGKVQPEILTVIEKRQRHRQEGGWVFFRSDRQSEIVHWAPAELYAAASPGNTVTGYYFPDGYFIPQYESDKKAGTAKWVFLGAGVLLGVLIFLGCKYD